ncbi:MAG: DUF502 domain-containing protein [Rhizobiales bacterium]|nr:DUF502 domain-containing protein [Hyphomicrobiales bacterium]
MTSGPDQHDGFIHVPRPSVGARLRAYFFTGVVIVGPLAVTAYITWWFIDTVDGWIKPLIPDRFWPDSYLPFHLPGLGVIIALIGLTLLGFLAANLAGRSLLRLGERILDRMPVVRGLYKSLKQVFETVFSQSGSSFRKVGLVEFPAKGMWSIVFISAPPGAGVATHLPQSEHLSVFLPCTPNPTTGFFFYLPASDVIEVPMTTDQAAKLIMSAGLIQPEGQAQLAAMAGAARAGRVAIPPGASVAGRVDEPAAPARITAP